MDDDIFAQFDPTPLGVGPKPPPEPKSNGRRKMKAGGKRGRPKKPVSVMADSKPAPESDIVRVRAPRKPRVPKIEVAEVVTKMFLKLSPKQRERVMATLTRLFT
jgi:hypothetical protein